MEKQCSACGNKVSAEARFCTKCGGSAFTRASAPAFCTQCGTPIQAGSAFCTACGARQEAAQPTPPPAYGAAQQNAYGQTPPPAYGAPQQNAYGQTPPPAYGAPQQNAYGQTPPPGYGAAQPNAYAQMPPPGYGMPPRHVSRREFIENYAPATKRSITTIAIICYFCAAVTLILAILFSPLGILDGSVLLALGLGIHIAKSRGCGIALFIFSLVETVLSLAFGSFPWLILVAGISALTTFVSVEKQYQNFLRGNGAYPMM